MTTTFTANDAEPDLAPSLLLHHKLMGTLHALIADLMAESSQEVLLERTGAALAVLREIDPASFDGADA